MMAKRKHVADDPPSPADDDAAKAPKVKRGKESKEVMPKYFPWPPALAATLWETFVYILLDILIFTHSLYRYAPHTLW